MEVRPSFSEDPTRRRRNSELFDFYPFNPPGRAFFLRDALRKVCEQYSEADFANGTPHFTEVEVAGKTEEAFVQYNGRTATYLLFRREGWYAAKAPDPLERQ